MDAIQDQIVFQEQMNLKAQDANIQLSRQQQAYCYRETMAKELSGPASAVVCLSLIAFTVFTLVSRAIRSNERVSLDRNQASIAIAKYENEPDNDDEQNESN